MNKKIGNVLFGIGCSLIFMYGMWFFILVGIVDPEAYQTLDISKGIQNKTKDVTIIYQFEFHEPVTIVSDTNTERTAAIDVSGIISGILIGSSLLIIGKIVNRFWPDKKQQ